MQFALAIGDIMHNLAALSEGDAAMDPCCTGKVYKLKQCGYPLSKLKDGVEGFDDLLWETKRSEDLHGSIAVMHRGHGFVYTRAS